ncbi:MAG: hypothetical protein K2L28_00315 [Muribaculaceae bacterium]|nr:hypothetical protein [Muribaculaceae bacterium]
MTDFDKKLVEKAKSFRRWDYYKIDILISIADTPEGRTELANIRWDLYELIEESI